MSVPSGNGNVYTVGTWNINGIRTAKDFKSTLDSLNCDIVCIQETKITREMLSEPVAIVSGYSSYFDFSQRRSGYSGVATYCRAGATPEAAEPGLAGWRRPAGEPGRMGATPGLAGWRRPAGEPGVGCYGEIPAMVDRQERAALDAEGRCMVTVHRLSCTCRGEDAGSCRLAVVNVYCPRVDPDRPERLQYKLLFYGALKERARALQTAGYHVLVVGDLNCTHRPIDTCDPGEPQEFESNPSRQFLNSWLAPLGEDDATSSKRSTSEDDSRLVDTFRHLHPDTPEVYTCWNTQKGARQCNYGTRIDYILSDRRMTSQLMRCDVMSGVTGSDHCPVRAEWQGGLQPAQTCPPACTRWYPEFAGKQVTLKELCARLPPQKAKPPCKGALTGKGKRANGEANGNRTAKRPRGQATLLSFFKPSTVTSKLNATNSCDLEVKSETSVKESCMDRVENTGEAPRLSCGSESVTDTPPEESAELTNDLNAPSSQQGSDSVSRASDPAASFWRQALRGRRPPACRGHGELCVLRTVKKPGANLGRSFWCCARGIGKPADPQARCEHFQWVPR